MGEAQRRPVETGLVRYDEMCRVIATVTEVDEAKEIRDKAKALEVYAKQANNYAAENKAAEIRLRAERKCGELLAERQKATGADKGGRPDLDGRRKLPSNPPKTLAEMGLTKDQSSKFQKMAEIPEEDFESAIQGAPARQLSTTAILQSHGKLPATPKFRTKMDDRTFWASQIFVEFERHRIGERPLSEMLPVMEQELREDVERLFPLLKRWVNEYDG